MSDSLFNPAQLFGYNDQDFKKEETPMSRKPEAEVANDLQFEKAECERLQQLVHPDFPVLSGHGL